MGAGKAHQARNQDADCDPSYVHQHMLRQRRNWVGKHKRASSGKKYNVLNRIRIKIKLTFMSDS